MREITITIYLFCSITNGHRIFVDIMTGENLRQFRLLTWILLIGQFVPPVGEEGMG